MSKKPTVNTFGIEDDDDEGFEEELDPVDAPETDVYNVLYQAGLVDRRGIPRNVDEW